MIRLKISHITLIPFLFFGYALLVNVSLFAQGPAPKASLTWDAASARAFIDQLYADEQPHRPFAQAALGALRYLVLREGRDGVVVAPQGWLLSDEEFRPALPVNQAQALRQEIVALAQGVQAKGGQVIVLLLPTKAESIGLVSPAAVDREKVSLIEELRHANIAFLDASEVLNGRLNFFKTDTHWTRKGVTGTSELLANSFPMLHGQAEVSYEAAQAESFAGDLIPFVTTERLAPVIGLPEERAVVQRVSIVDEETADLFAAPQDAHALVGTSFSANPRWGFEDALKRTLSHDVLNFAAQGQGPLAPMQAYLEQVEAMDQTYVIWEIPLRYLTDASLLEASP